jgi:hypothetical protein
VEEERKVILTEEQKRLIEIERQKIRDNPNYMIDWEVARKMLRWDSDAADEIPD